MKKTLLLIFVGFAIHYKCNAQLYYGQQSDKIAIYGLATDIGYGLKLGYIHSFSDEFSIEPALVYDYGRPFQTKYQSIGLDIGGNYTAFEIGQSFNLGVKLIGSVSQESLSNFTTNKISGINYGGKIGPEFNYNLSNQITFGLYGLQTYMVKKTFGNTRFEAGLTMKISIN